MYGTVALLVFFFGVILYEPCEALGISACVSSVSLSFSIEAQATYTYIGGLIGPTQLFFRVFIHPPPRRGVGVVQYSIRSYISNIM